jgi:hypothetical protein
VLESKAFETLAFRPSIRPWVIGILEKRTDRLVSYLERGLTPSTSATELFQRIEPTVGKLMQSPQFSHQDVRPARDPCPLRLTAEVRSLAAGPAVSCRTIYSWTMLLCRDGASLEHMRG